MAILNNITNPAEEPVNGQGKTSVEDQRKADVRADDLVDAAPAADKPIKRKARSKASEQTTESPGKKAAAKRNDHHTEVAGKTADANAKTKVKPRPAVADKPKTDVAKSTKAEQVLKKLRSARGATIDMLMQATGWQAHSVRGFLSAVVKKKLGLNLVKRDRQGWCAPLPDRRWRQAGVICMRSDRKLEDEVATVGDLSRDELMVRWTKAYGCPPPKGIKRGLQERSAAWHQQASRLGGLSQMARRAIRTASSAPSRTGDGKKTNAAAALPASAALPVQLRPGTRLMREWNGRMHVVDVVDDGFLFDGKSYRSLSAIARRITGAHWSGPRFFGL